MSIINGKINEITFSKSKMTIHFEDGRTVASPIAWYPRLKNASDEQRKKWKVLGKNRGIHWPAIDEDLSLEGILKGIPSAEYGRTDFRNVY